jgi:hypothetical protein
MVLPRILLCLTLLGPYVGLAQESNETPVSSASEPQPIPPPPLLPAPEGSEAEPPEGQLFPREFETEQPPGENFTVGRGALELLGGAVVGSGVAVVAMLLTSIAIDPGCSSESCILTLFIVGPTAALFAIPLGVYGVGRLMNGQGGYGATLLGTVVGTGLGITAAVALKEGTAAVVAVIAGPLLGAVVGYELSHAYSQRGVSPTIGLSPTGGVVVGLSGRF